MSELEAEADFVLVDAGSGLGSGISILASAVDQAVIVSTPEPTSIADAHAAIGRFGPLNSPSRIRLLINQAASTAEAAEILDRLVASSRHFQGAVVSPLGTGAIRADPHVPLAVRARKPFLTAFPGSIAARGVRRLARRWSRNAIRQAAIPALGFSGPSRPAGLSRWSHGESEKRCETAKNGREVPWSGRDSGMGMLERAEE